MKVVLATVAALVMITSAERSTWPRSSRCKFAFMSTSSRKHPSFEILWKRGAADVNLGGSFVQEAMDSPGGSSRVLYFAYGANMSPRCLTGKRGVRPVLSTPAKALLLVVTGTSSSDGKTPGDGDVERPQLSFCHRGGFANVVHAPGPPQAWEAFPETHGVLHVITREEMELVAKKEAGYSMSKVSCSRAL
ncbi:unnamed protein product [Discosporangium mesarthrocarpum]